MKIAYSVFRYLFLYPISLLYGLAVWCRNRLYDVNILPSSEFSIPVISIGNITVGGTGKTIHVEYIVTFLKETCKLAVLSRGYKRETEGYIKATTQMSYKEIGDEPRQIVQKFKDVIVAVDASRKRGIETLIREDGVEVVLLDDAYQHRSVTPGLNILLIDYSKPLKKDYLLPFGRLREQVTELKRADIIIVTKVPSDIKPIELRILEKEVKRFAFQKVFFTTLEHGQPMPVFPEVHPNTIFNPLRYSPSVLMVTGIVNAKPLQRHLGIFAKSTAAMEFPDHHSYSIMDMRNIIDRFSEIADPNKYIITTEKDAMRFQSFVDLDEEIKKRMYYIPVTIEFMENQAENFQKQITHHVSINKSNDILHQKINRRKSNDGDNHGLRTGWSDRSFKR